jgi:hypothetical protein
VRQLPPREVESRAIHSHKLLPGQPTRAYPLTRPIHPHAHTLPTSRVEFTRVHRLTPPWFAPTTGGVFGALVRVAGVRIHSSGVGDWRIAVSWFFKVVRLNNIRHGGGQSPTMRAALDSSRCIFANSDSARHMHHPLPRHQGEEGSRGDMWGAGVETTSAWGLRHIYTTNCVREDELHTCPVWEPPQHPSRATGDADKGARWKTAWTGAGASIKEWLVRTWFTHAAGGMCGAGGGANGMCGCCMGHEPIAVASFHCSCAQRTASCLIRGEESGWDTFIDQTSAGREREWTCLAASQVVASQSMPCLGARSGVCCPLTQTPAAREAERECCLRTLVLAARLVGSYTMLRKSNTDGLTPRFHAQRRKLTSDSDSRIKKGTCAPRTGVTRAAACSAR